MKRPCHLNIIKLTVFTQSVINNINIKKGKKMKLNSIMFYLGSALCSSVIMSQSMVCGLDKEDSSDKQLNIQGIQIPESVIPMDEEVFTNQGIETNHNARKLISSKLEHVYLMNVALYLRDSKDMQNFAQVCKKAQEASYLSIHRNQVSITPNQLEQYPKLATLDLQTYDDIYNWEDQRLKARNKVHRIDVWPEMRYFDANKKLDKLKKLVKKPQNRGSITFHNIYVNQGDNLGTIKNGRFVFNNDVYTGNVVNVNDIPLQSNMKATDTTYIIKHLNSRSFYCMDELRDLTIPNTVTYISDSAIVRNTQLSSISLPVSLKNIGHHGINGCHQLKSIDIPTSVSGLSSFAIFDCTALSKITLPNNVFGIGHCVVQRCNNCTVVVANEKMKRMLTLHKLPNNISVDTSLNNSAFDWGWPDNGILEIPEIVTRIYDYNFMDRLDLTSITIPSTVKKIGFSAFCGCKNLVNITIPESVTYIGSRAFKGCTKLTGVNSLGSIKSLEYEVFSECKSLTSIYIPSTVTLIEWRSLFGCTNLTSLHIPDSVYQLEDFALNFKYLKLPKKLTTEYNLKCLEINANEVTIPINLFYQCNITDMIKHNNMIEVINVIYDSKISMVTTLQIIGTICSKFEPEKRPTINFIHSSDWKPKI